MNMNINWKVRVKNKVFWIAVIPAAILFIQAMTSVFGYSLDLSWLSDRLSALVEAAFYLLAVLGIVADPTTSGLADSEQALTYTQPKED